MTEKTIGLVDLAERILLFKIKLFWWLYGVDPCWFTLLQTNLIVIIIDNGTVVDAYI